MSGWIIKEELSLLLLIMKLALADLFGFTAFTQHLSDSDFIFTLRWKMLAINSVIYFFCTAYFVIFKKLL